MGARLLASAEGCCEKHLGSHHHRLLPARPGAIAKPEPIRTLRDHSIAGSLLVAVFWRATGLAYTVHYRRRVDSSRTDSGHRAREGRPAQKGQMGAAAGLLPLTIGTGFSFASLWIALDWHEVQIIRRRLLPVNVSWTLHWHSVWLGRWSVISDTFDFGGWLIPSTSWPIRTASAHNTLALCFPALVW
jgi:hypothetical protein